MTMALRLSDILLRGVVTEWYEAVALVRAVADRVLERPGAHSVPELADIELAASGEVFVTGGLSIDEPVRRLGQLLQATLVQSEPPVQLRLLVSQATAPVSTFGSIREFQEALGYFERPDRQAVLQHLYARAGVAGATETRAVPTIDMIAPLAGPEPSSPTQAKPRPKPRPRVWLAFAAAILVVVSAAAYAQYSGRSSASQLSAVALKASDVMGTAVVAGISSVTERAGLGRLAPAEHSGSIQPAAPTPAPSTVLSVGPRRIAPRPQRANTPPYRAFDLEPVPSLETATAGDDEPNAGAAAAATTGGHSVRVPDTKIYSASDAVVPPVGIRPQLPRTVPPEIDKERMARLELLILADGTVGSVKLLGHRDVRDAMLVSAAKAWEFRPAMKDGQPVSYRKVVWMTFQ